MKKEILNYFELELAAAMAAVKKGNGSNEHAHLLSQMRDYCKRHLPADAVLLDIIGDTMRALQMCENMTGYKATDRSHEARLSRALFVHIMRKKYTLQQIGDAIGYDHSTIYHYQRQVKNALEFPKRDRNLAELIEKYENDLIPAENAKV